MTEATGLNSACPVVVITVGDDRPAARPEQVLDQLPTTTDAPYPTGRVRIQICCVHEDIKEGVSPNEMLKRAREAGIVLGERHARQILVETLPEEWEKYWILFPGTLRMTNGNLMGGNPPITLALVLRKESGLWKLEWIKFTPDRQFPSYFRVAVAVPEQPIGTA